MSENVEVMMGSIKHNHEGDEAMMFKMNIPLDMIKQTTTPEQRQKLAEAIMAGLDNAIGNYSNFVNDLKRQQGLPPEELPKPWRPNN